MVRAWLILIVGLAASGSPCIAGVELTVEEAGLRGHATHDGVVLRLGVTNQDAVALRGRLSAQLIAPTAEKDPRTSWVLDLPAGGRESVCLPLPYNGYKLADKETLLSLRVADDDGTERARLQIAPDKILAFSSGDGKRIGILASRTIDAKTVQNAILFPPDLGDRDFFNRPELTMLHLGPQTSSCATAYQYLDGLVVALPPERLTAVQRDAIAQAAFGGVHLTIVESLTDNTPFLRDVSSERPLPTEFGQGAIDRVRSPEALGISMPFLGHDDDSSPHLDRARRAVWTGDRPTDLIDPNAFVRVRFLSARFPSKAQIIATMCGYVLLVGPATFFVLRALNRREWTWIVSPALALVCSLALLAWIRAAKFADVELDSAEFRYSHDAYPQVRRDLSLRIGSPTEARYSLSVPGSWQPPRGAFAAGSIVFSRDNTVVEHVSVQQWSTVDVDLTATAVSPSPSFVLAAEGVRHSLPESVDEAMLVLPSGLCERRDWRPGEPWTCERPHEALPLSPADENDRCSQENGLRCLLRDCGCHKDVWKSATAVLVASVGRDGASARLEPQASVRRAWTVYVHVFSRPVTPSREGHTQRVAPASGTAPKER